MPASDDPADSETPGQRKPGLREPGLRERKKAQTRQRIQSVALNLFETRGFSQTSVDQIADEADLSPATVFRYFPTKEDTVTHNAFTPAFLDALRDQPPESPPMGAIRAALRVAAAQFDHEQWNHERRRQLYVITEPALRGPSIGELHELSRSLAGELASHTTAHATSLELRVAVGAILGTFATVIMTTDLTVHDYVTSLSRALDHLEAGLPLPTTR